MKRKMQGLPCPQDGAADESITEATDAQDLLAIDTLTNRGLGLNEI